MKDSLAFLVPDFKMSQLINSTRLIMMPVVSKKLLKTVKCLRNEGNDV